VHTEGASEGEAAALDLRPGDPVVVLERVRTADQRPVVFSRDVVSVSTISAAELAAMQLDGSVYALLEQHGHAVEHGVVRIEPGRADRTLARRLGVKSGAMILVLVQVDYGREGDPVLLSEEFHLADAFEFTVVRRGPGRG
jgi:GntR family transcriptional regulator